MDLEAKISLLEEENKKLRLILSDSPDWSDLDADAFLINVLNMHLRRSYDMLRWAIGQMRRAARTIELLAAGGKIDNTIGKNIYSDGLDMCANAAELLLNE